MRGWINLWWLPIVPKGALYVNSIENNVIITKDSGIRVEIKNLLKSQVPTFVVVVVRGEYERGCFHGEYYSKLLQMAANTAQPSSAHQIAPLNFDPVERLFAYEECFSKSRFWVSYCEVMAITRVCIIGLQAAAQTVYYKGLFSCSHRCIYCSGALAVGYPGLAYKEPVCLIKQFNGSCSTHCWLTQLF